MTAETTNGPPRKGGAKRILTMLVRVFLAVGLLAAGFGGGYFYFAQSTSPADDVLSLIDKAETEHVEEPVLGEDGKPQKVAKPVPETATFITSYHTFADPLTTNLAGSRRYAQITIGLSTQYDVKVIENVKTHEVALRSDMLTVLGSFTEEEIAGKEGKDRLAAALREACNARLLELEGFGGIEGVFFPSFVLQ